MSISAHHTPAAALEKAQALIELRRYTEAAAMLAPLAASSPDDPYVWCLLASAQLGDGHAAEALASAQRAAGLAPESDWPHRLRSRALWHLARFDDSAAAARVAITLAPDEPAGYILLAQALVDVRGGLFEAGTAAHSALALAPDDPGAYFVLGVVEAAASNREKAGQAFRQALQIDPNHVAAMNELARLELRAGRVQRLAPARLAGAASGFADAVRTDPRAQTSRYNLDLTLRHFLGLVSYLIFLVVLLAAYWGPSSTSTIHRAAPVALIVPVLFAARFLTRLPRELRRHMFGLLARGSLRAAATLELLAITALLGSWLMPDAPRGALLGFAVCAAFVARFVLLGSTVWFGRHRLLRRLRPRSLRQLIGRVVLSLLVLSLFLRLVSLVVFSPAVRHWLHVGSQLPSCSDAGISTTAAREGSCVRNVGLFGQGTTYVVVDRAHTLHMPGYTAHLITERITGTPVSGTNLNPTDFPHNTGLLVSFKLAITNTGTAPLSFDATGQDAGLLLPREENGIGEAINARGLLSPIFTGRLPLRPHATMTGWVNFVTPVWAGRTVNARPSDLELFLSGQNRGDYVGQIRLWH